MKKSELSYSDLTSGFASVTNSGYVHEYESTYFVTEIQELKRHYKYATYSPVIIDTEIVDNKLLTTSMICETYAIHNDTESLDEVLDVLNEELGDFSHIFTIKLPGVDWNMRTIPKNSEIRYRGIRDTKGIRIVEHRRKKLKRIDAKFTNKI